MSSRCSPAALIFDFDGVLADTEGLHCSAFQAVLRDIGVALSPADYYTRFLGLPDRACLVAACAMAGLTPDPRELDILVTRKREQFAQLSRATGLYPGITTALERLQQTFVLAVASGAFRDEIETVLERARVRSLFTAVVGAEDVRTGKPAPDPFLSALRQINHSTGRCLSPADCIVIEDSPRGIAAAQAAGMRCIAVATTHDRATLAAAAPDAIIDHARTLRAEELNR